MEINLVKKVSSLCLVFCFLLCFLQIQAQQYSGHLDQQLKKMNPPLDQEAPYSFFAIGNIYGDATSATTPSTTLLEKLDALKGNGDFWITLGNSFEKSNQSTLTNYSENFLKKMVPPVFNVVGNHEYKNRDLYEQSFGPTFFSFEYQGDLFVIINTELNQGSIKEEQLEWLHKTEKRISVNKYRNTFICANKLIWAVQDEYDIANRRSNVKDGHLNTTNYLEEVQPIFERISEETQLYILSGDIGKPWSYPLFYDYNEAQNIHYIATGIGNLPTDMFLQINVSNQGVDIQPTALGTSVTRPIEHYGIAEWNRYFKKDQVNSEPKGYNWFLIVFSIGLAFLLSYFFGKNEQ